LVGARAAGKMAGALIVAPLGGLRLRQAVGLGLALMPMSSVTLLLQHDIARLYPAFGASLGAMFIAAIIVMEVAGPLAVQLGFRLAGETLPEEEPVALAGSSRAT